MKKIVLSSFLFISLVGYGQVGFDIGAKLGANFNNVQTADDINIQGASTFHGGLLFRLKFLSFAIQPEVLYSRQDYILQLTTLSLARSLNHVNIPVILKYYFISGLNIQAGPQFGFLISADAKDELGIDISDQLEKSDVSVAMGLGWDSSTGFSINARYLIGLSDIKDAAITQDAKNSIFQVSFGFRFLSF